MRQITITVPIPPKFCNPNARSRNHHANAAHKKQAKEESRDAAYVAVGQLEDWRSYNFPWDFADWHITWFHPTDQLKDRDNIIAGLKSTLDGLTLSGVLADDKDLSDPTTSREVDRENPRVEITLTCHDESY